METRQERFSRILEGAAGKEWSEWTDEEKAALEGMTVGEWKDDSEWSNDCLTREGQAMISMF